MADILVVDDDKLMVEMISEIFLDEGDEVRFALDGHGALEAIAEKVPDTLILDMYMPGLTGFEVAKALRADPNTASLPILALTSLDTAGDCDAAHEAGCDVYIRKPFQTPQLVTVVRDLLASRR